MYLLGSVKNVESVYYSCFGALDAAIKPISKPREIFFFCCQDALNTDQPRLTFRSPNVPLAAMECFGFEGLSEAPPVFLASRSFARTG